MKPFLRRTIKLHDSCGVQSLHLWPGLIAGILGIIYAACSSFDEYKDALYGLTLIFLFLFIAVIKHWNENYFFLQKDIYPGRLSSGNSSLAGEAATDSHTLGRTAGEQSAYQLAALAITAAVALVSGLLTGFLLRLPIFEQLSKNVEMFDDEVQWVTPDDYALKLTLAAQQVTEKKEDSKV